MLLPALRLTVKRFQLAPGLAPGRGRLAAVRSAAVHSYADAKRSWPGKPIRSGLLAVLIDAPDVVKLRRVQHQGRTNAASRARAAGLRGVVGVEVQLEG